jgi:hypothetical protein
MKKLKGINGYIHKDFVHKDVNHYVFRTTLSGERVGEFVQAKLIIELPEKKVEITESRLDEIFNGLTEYSNSEWYRARLKKVLFGER